MPPQIGLALIPPGISSKPSQLREVVRAAREAGACGVWANVLFLRPGTREHFMAALAEDIRLEPEPPVIAEQLALAV